MDSINTRLHEDQSSRRKRKMTFIISLIILFTIIICSIILVLTILKHKAESESLPNSNPIKAIRAVCSLTPLPSSCFTQIWHLQSIQTSSKTNPSEIFALSFRASFDELTILNSESQIAISKVNASSRVWSSLKECESLIADSLKLMNISITTNETVPEDKNFKETENVRDLNERISKAKGNLNSCMNGLEDAHATVIIGKFYLARMKMKMLVTTNYLNNILVILAKMDTIMDMFYPPVQNMLADFLSSSGGFDFGIVFFGLQYLLLIFLFCLLLRL